MFDKVDEDGSEEIDQDEFESMVVVLSQNITVRVIAQLLIQFALAPCLATVLLHKILTEYFSFAAFSSVASRYIPDVLMTYVFNEALMIIALAALVKAVVIPPVDSYLGRLTQASKKSEKSKVKSTSA